MTQFVAPTLFLLIVWEHVGELADDPEHDLVRAAADAPQSQVPVQCTACWPVLYCIALYWPVQPADRHLVREAHPTPELEAGVGDLPG